MSLAGCSATGTSLLHPLEGRGVVVAVDGALWCGVVAGQGRVQTDPEPPDWHSEGHGRVESWRYARHGRFGRMDPGRRHPAAGDTRHAGQVPCGTASPTRHGPLCGRDVRQPTVTTGDEIRSTHARDNPLSRMRRTRPDHRAVLAGGDRRPGRAPE